VGSSGYRYAGFISYSHRDRKVGEWLHRALERYRVPRHLIGQPGAHGPVPARLYPIFRDRDELSAGVLARQLHVAIGQSRCFILICSPHSASSHWVNEEVEHFLSSGGDPGCLLCLIADGEPNATAQGRPERECLPPALRNRIIDGLPFEPMAAQLDADADGRDNARLKLIAGMLGVGYDELKRRDLVARNRRLAMLAGLSLGVAAMTVALAIYAVLAQREAERSRQQGEDLIGFMLGALRGKLEPLGKLDILDAVGDQAIAYFAGLDTGRDPGPRALAARAKALRQIGEVRFAQGRPAEAVDTLTAALKIQRDLSRRQPDDNELLFELGQTEFWVGYAAWRAGRYDPAEINFKAYNEISRQLVRRQPDSKRFQAEVAYALVNLGVLAYERRRYSEALPLFDQASVAAQPVLDDPGSDIQTRFQLLDAMSWQGSTLMALRRYDDSLSRFAEHAERGRRQLAEHPDDRRLQAAFASSLSTYGFAAIEAGRPELVADLHREGIALTGQLMATDPANIDYRARALNYRLLEAWMLFQQAHWQASATAVRSLRPEILALLHDEPAFQRVRTLLLSSWLLSWELAWQLGDLAFAQQIAGQALQVAGSSPTVRDEGRVDLAFAHLFALELAQYVDRNPASAARHRDAARVLVAAISGSSAGDEDRNDRLQALLDLMSGLDRTPAAANPASHAPWASSVSRFIERRCRPRQPQLPASLCKRGTGDHADAGQRRISRLALPR